MGLHGRKDACEAVIPRSLACWQKAHCSRPLLLFSFLMCGFPVLGVPFRRAKRQGECHGEACVEMLLKRKLLSLRPLVIAVHRIASLAPYLLYFSPEDCGHAGRRRAGRNGRHISLENRPALRAAYGAP